MASNHHLSTRQAASQLVAGDAPVIALSKRCIKGNGVLSEGLYVEMSCIRKHGKPWAFLCEVRPADPYASWRADQRSVPQGDSDEDWEPQG